ncbi:unnamed protein product [Pedinophyceae sp. YPF-701]|nr:unnamed protein product [Pedinophyceae sp. YPF-701]
MVAPRARCAQARRSVVVEAKGKTRMRGGGAPRGQPQIPVPPVDPNNAEFVIFVRSKKLPSWAPLTIIKGGAAANMLVKSQESDLGQKLYKDTLTKNLAQALYKDYNSVCGQVRRQYPMLKAAKELEFGYKIRDKENPAEWYVPKGIKVMPDKDGFEEMSDNVFDNIGKSVSKFLKGGAPVKSGL